MRGINTATFGGNLGATPERRTVTLKDGNTTELIEFNMYVDSSTRKDAPSFIVQVTCWAGSASFNAAGYLKKGSEVTVTGPLSFSPYIVDGSPRSGVKLNCVTLCLGRSPRDEQSTDDLVPAEQPAPEPVAEVPAKNTRSRKAKTPALATV